MRQSWSRVGIWILDGFAFGRGPDTTVKMLSMLVISSPSELILKSRIVAMEFKGGWT